MVDSIGSDKIRPIAHKRTIHAAGKDNSKRNRKQALKKSQQEVEGNDRVGANIDERC